MPTDYRDPPAVWSIYGAHAAVMLRCGPAVMVAPAPGRVFVLSGADHVDLNQVALYRPAGRELATETVSLAFDAGVPVLLAVSSTVSEDVSDALATGGFLRTSKREALFWSPHLPPEADSPFVIERVATGRTHAAARFVFASVHGYSAAMVDAAYGPRLLAHNDVDAWVAWEGNTPVGAVYITTVDGTLGVFEMMTVPAYRRRGVGRALLSGRSPLPPPAVNSRSGRRAFGQPRTVSLCTPPSASQLWTFSRSGHSERPRRILPP